MAGNTTTMNFDLNATFPSIVSKTGGLDEYTMTTTGVGDLNLAGPQQPAMTPTQTVEFGYESKSAKSDDPNWNTRSEEAGVID